jgi:hypothetical protein
LNVTGNNLAVGIVWNMHVHFTFYSSVDYYGGIGFDIVKLFVNGTRYVVPDVVAPSVMINVTLKDYANNTVYSMALNTTVLGTYLDLGLNLVPIAITNNFGHGVLLHYSIGSLSVVTAVGARDTITLRYAPSNFSWWISDANNVRLGYENGTYYGGTQSITTSTTIDFGWTAAAITPVVDPTNTYVIILMLAAGFGAGIGIPLAWLGKAKQAAAVRKGKPKPKTHMKDH